MSNHITFGLCEEDRARLDRLTEVLEKLLPRQLMLRTETAKPNAMTALPEAEPVEEEPKPAEPEKPTVSLADVQALVQKLATPTSGKRDAVKNIVNAYAKRVSDIPTDKLAEVMTKLTELEGQA